MVKEESLEQEEIEESPMPHPSSRDGASGGGRYSAKGTTVSMPVSRPRVENGFLPLVPVRTDKPILKDKLRDALNEIALKKIKAPIKAGDILIENILGLEANVIASRDLIEGK